MRKMVQYLQEQLNKQSQTSFEWETRYKMLEQQSSVSARYHCRFRLGTRCYSATSLNESSFLGVPCYFVFNTCEVIDTCHLATRAQTCDAAQNWRSHIRCTTTCTSIKSTCSPSCASDRHSPTSNCSTTRRVRDSS